MHLHVADAEARGVEVEDHVVVLGQQRHRHGAVGDLVGDHVGREAHPEGVVVVAGVPDRHAVGLPGLLRADGEGLARHVLDGAAARGAGVLDQRDRVQLDHPGALLAVFGGAGRIVLVLAFAADGVVEGPVLGLALAALHDEALGGVVAGLIGLEVAVREVEVFHRHAQLRTDAREAEIPVRLGEAEREVHAGGLAVVEAPLVHAPEVGVLEVQTDQVLLIQILL